MKKYFLFTLLSLTIISATAAFAFSAAQRSHDNIEFLKSYGWEVSEKPIEKATFTLPDALDAIYENYQELQLQAGLNLIPYLGKSGVRYTYRVTNYPKPVTDEVRANVLIIDGTPIAGDICTISLDGFMHSLQIPK